MDFAIEQTYAADPDEVARAYTESGLYDSIGEGSTRAHPEVLSRTVDGAGRVVLRIRYRLAAELSEEARAVLDPDKVTWVEHSTHEVARRHTDYRLVPDNYVDLVRISAQCTTRRGPHGGAIRTVEGTLRVKVPHVAGAVETAIVSGLSEHLTAEARTVERFLAGT